MKNVLTIMAPSASPSHPDYAKLLNGIAQIVAADAPLIIDLAPSNGKLGVALVGAELGLSMAQEIAQLLAQLHPQKTV